MPAATLPSLTGRMVAQSTSAEMKKRLPNGPIPELQKLFYDTANAANPWAHRTAAEACFNIADSLRHRFFRFAARRTPQQGLRDVELFSAAELRAIDRDNALRLLPRLKA